MPSVDMLCVIDDDLIYQFAVKLNLKQLQLAESVQTFSNGDLARQFFLEHKDDPQSLPDVILLDINMPIMDGWDFLEWYKSAKEQLSKQIPIIMVSSSIDWRDIEKAKSYEEVLDYMSKPLTDGNFFEIIERIGS